MSSPPLFSLPFDEIVRRTAEHSAYPGGGAAAAMACSSAAALVAMAARYTGTVADPARSSAEAAIDELHRLADEDADVYGALLDAWQRSPDDPERRERVAAAALGACGVPLRIARLGSEIARQGVWLASEGKRDLRGDAFTAAQLASAGVRGAARLVELNARQAEDRRPAEEARSLVRQTSRLIDEMESENQ